MKTYVVCFLEGCDLQQCYRLVRENDNNVVKKNVFLLSVLIFFDFFLSFLVFIWSVVFVSYEVLYFLFLGALGPRVPKRLYWVAPKGAPSHLCCITESSSRGPEKSLLLTKHIQNQ